MENNTKISEKEILESLLRSGYLLESEITKQLVDYGFFVESNTASLDPLTGKSREIDLVAEYEHEYNADRYKNKAIARVTFVFEIKNNNAPIVLMTKHEHSPISDLYNALKVGITIPDYFKAYYYESFDDILINDNHNKLFTQYCSFSKKKNEELMAHHPENIYSSLLKITHFCEDSIEYWNDDDRSTKQDYFRNFLYLPIVLINENLYELEIIENNENKLTKVDCSRLVFNYHHNEKPKTSIVYIVTKVGLNAFLDEILKAEKTVEENMVTLMTKNQAQQAS